MSTSWKTEQLLHATVADLFQLLRFGLSAEVWVRNLIFTKSLFHLVLAAGDPLSIAKMTYAYGRLTFDQLAHALKEVTDGATNYVKNKAPKMEF